MLQRLTDALRRGREQIVCQVVETKGSTPQKAGALMVVDPDGGQAGTLGGGCVEGRGEAAGDPPDRARTETEIHSVHPRPRLRLGRTASICGGKMVIAAEALRGSELLAYFRVYQQLLDAGEGFTEAVVVNEERAGVPVGCRFLFDHDGSLAAAWPATSAPGKVVDGVILLPDRPRPSVKAGVAYLPTLPRIRLVVVGGGHVGLGVASLAAQADFEVWVVDDRHQYANRRPISTAARLIVGLIDEVLPALEITSHLYAPDRHPGSWPRPGSGFIIWPRPRRNLCRPDREPPQDSAHLREFAGHGFVRVDPSADVAAPVGLEIGSQTVPEIAISIVAELIARRNLGPGGQATRPTRSSRLDDEVPVSGFPPHDRVDRSRGWSKRADGPAQTDPVHRRTDDHRTTGSERFAGGAEPVVVVTPLAGAGAGLLIDEADRAEALVVVPQSPAHPRCVSPFRTRIGSSGTIRPSLSDPALPGRQPRDYSRSCRSTCGTGSKSSGSRSSSQRFRGRRGHPIVPPPEGWLLKNR